jgi:glutaredoxin
VPLRTVTVYHAESCHLCDRAIEVVTEARRRQTFDLELVDIGGDAALEAAYREHLPVIEIDGSRAFTYFVSVDALLDRLGSDGSPGRLPEGAGNM